MTISSTIELPADFPVEVLRPGDTGYDTARSVFNAMIDRRPLAIVRCRTATDVARGIGLARDRDLVVSVRGGGHNVAGNAVCDGGIMLDLSPMKAAQVDAAARTGRAGAGLLLGELDRATQQVGLATPLGVVSETGIAGLTLGGGLGWLNGRYGLAGDNLVGAEVVTAAGDVLDVDTENHPDLLWGLRGGGGNLGIVSTFTFRLHPVGPVLAGGLAYRWATARNVLRFHDEFMATAPDELSTAVSLSRDAVGDPVLGIGLCWCGDPETGERVVAPLRSFGAPVLDTVSVLPYAVWQSAPDAGYPRGRQHYWKSGWLRTLTDDAIDVLLDLVPQIPPPASGIGLQGLRGAASRVAPDATAFPHRAAQYDFLIVGQWADPHQSARNIAWTREAFEAVRPHLEDAVYVNNLGTEGPDRVRAAYGRESPQAGRAQGHLRPGQRVPPQPERRAPMIRPSLDSANVRRGFRRVAAAAGLDASDWTPREMRHSSCRCSPTKSCRSNRSPGSSDTPEDRRSPRPSTEAAPTGHPRWRHRHEPRLPPPRR